MVAGKLDKLMALTREVQALVEAGDWAAAASLESRRRPLVDAFLASGPSEAEKAAAGRIIREVVAMDARMLAHIDREKAAALGTLKQEMGAGQAARAYLEHASTMRVP